MTRSAGHIGRTHAHAGHRRTGAPSVRMRQGESLWERGHRRDGLRDMTRMTSLDNTPTLIILDRLVAEVGALIDDLDAEAWTAPTPCAEFDAHRLVEHLVGGLQDMRAAAEGQPAHGFAAPSIQLADAAQALPGRGSGDSRRVVGAGQARRGLRDAMGACSRQRTSSDSSSSNKSFTDGTCARRWAGGRSSTRRRSRSPTVWPGPWTAMRCGRQACSALRPSRRPRRRRWKSWSLSSVGGPELVAEPGGRYARRSVCRAQSTCGELGSVVDEMVCATTPLGFLSGRITVGRGPGAGAG